MSTSLLGLAIESLVAILLVMTIGYCWILNRRLMRLRADEAMLRGIAAELIAATGAAERAIGTLKTMATDCDRTLAQRLASAEDLSGEIAAQIQAGETVLDRIAQITEAARPPRPAPAMPRLEPVAAPAVPPPPIAAAAPPRPSHRERTGATARAAAALAETLARRAGLHERGAAA
ncbi:DUF6468 domain-containing protein [Labrys wisconsinensis]|uniref:DUF6468 domain-containing protein n=1 Tax=Labrys wisconsinensis TaxID=425677 RepID=A0ABU0JAY0_9HYPH|nr:DUF6468 domain-containing protein [Labrys wisconsinensis]MDQ0471428.1 hypothetical protein [Labrys wisconsinensis]